MSADGAGGALCVESRAVSGNRKDRGGGGEFQKDGKFELHPLYENQLMWAELELRSLIRIM